ncbi:acetyl-CoA carboxylase biotin carboxyl carrier protein subunit [Ammoniphilus oxalaticus]|uniref:Acetyl-CoA carboxylase biotin carboxyl carrier protein subunit n=1 Tax=Ammoniphilus oxalaticus TaxID=66863 RepID=A0A419SJE7_9BACL|nr:acetyl-CoA carboxylase biotin carboxyl carrier protein subunit [Ammoniphilus oxalaticus]RKD24082.1 acetyl-CoA carboxylase biotin carboxyl carrier protein subunit [Ammoniphilus oxalaticus]
MKQVRANMAGIVLRICVQTGEQVSAGQDLIVLESMKMEVPIQAESAGKVEEIKVNVGDFINEGDLALILV